MINSKKWRKNNFSDPFYNSFNISLCHLIRNYMIDSIANEFYISPKSHFTNRILNVPNCSYVF